MVVCAIGVANGFKDNTDGDDIASLPSIGGRNGELYCRDEDLNGRGQWYGAM
jgi:hypothetical protein